MADLNGDGWNDVVVGCYISNSYPPYTDWENLIYFNTGGQLEANPSWVSADEVSTGDIQVALINDDAYPDVFAANGGASMSASVIYFGGPSGPSTTPGWYSAVPGAAWSNYALPFDIDHDGDVDVITANQGNSPRTPTGRSSSSSTTAAPWPTCPAGNRPWRRSRTSWRWATATATAGRTSPSPSGPTSRAASTPTAAASSRPRRSGPRATTDTDKGVAWADVDGDQWPDLALGHDPTQLWGNDQGALSVVWSAQAPYFGHSDVAFCDVDRTATRISPRTTSPTARSASTSTATACSTAFRPGPTTRPTVGTALAFGDLNGDQWPDLVVGNSGEPCVKVFYAVPSTTPVPADAAPRAVVLHGASPNPFNPCTTVAFTLATPATVALRIHDAAGRLVRVLASGEMLAAGRQEMVWDGRDDRGRDAPTGSYVAQLHASARRSSLQANTGQVVSRPVVSLQV